MSLEVQFFLAILPILVIFCGLVIFKRSGTLMGVIGWLLTVFLAIFFFQTSLVIALFASLMGVLASFGISLMVLFTILQVTLMDITGAIKCISDYIKSIAAERYEQVMILNVGLGSFLVSIGATPVTMLPPIMMALGFSPLASIALPCLGYDPLTSFSLLAVPITLPSSIFNLDASVFGGTISLFLPLISTGLSLGMLWVADGIDGIKKGFPTAVLAGLTLGFSCIFFVRILPTSAIGLVGVFSGLLTIFVLMIEKHIRGKRNRKSGKILNNTKKFIKIFESKSVEQKKVEQKKVEVIKTEKEKTEPTVKCPLCGSNDIHTSKKRKAPKGSYVKGKEVDLGYSYHYHICNKCQHKWEGEKIS